MRKMRNCLMFRVCALFLFSNYSQSHSHNLSQGFVRFLGPTMSHFLVDRIPWALLANLNPVLEFWPYRRWVKELSKLIWPTLGSTPHRSEVSDFMALFAFTFDVV